MIILNEQLADRVKGVQRKQEVPTGFDGLGLFDVYLLSLEESLKQYVPPTESSFVEDEILSAVVSRLQVAAVDFMAGETAFSVLCRLCIQSTI